MKPDLGSTGDQLVPMLKANSAIDANIFTMHLTDSSSSSYVEFGNPSTSGHLFAKLSNGATVWSTTFAGSNIDGLSINGLIFDSGSSNVYVPSKDQSAILNFIKSKDSSSDCKIASSKISCSCTSSNRDSKFPDILVTHGNDQGKLTLTMKGSQYMALDSSGSTCTAMFWTSPTFDTANYWLMGLPVYRAFEIVHDSGSMKIGFKAQGGASVAELATKTTGAMFAATSLMLATFLM
jgi:hypothetical protein